MPIDIRNGGLVYVNQVGFPPWPSIIVKSAPNPDEPTPSKNQVFLRYVYYFGRDEYGWVHIRNLRPLNRLRTVNPKKFRKSVIRFYNKASIELRSHLKKLDPSTKNEARTKKYFNSLLMSIKRGNFQKQKLDYVHNDRKRQLEENVDYVNIGNKRLLIDKNPQAFVEKLPYDMISKYVSGSECQISLLENGIKKYSTVSTLGHVSENEFECFYQQGYFQNNTHVTENSEIEDTSTSGKKIEDTSTSGKQIKDASTSRKKIEVASTSGKKIEVASTSGKKIEVASTSGKKIEVASTSGKEIEVASTSGKKIEVVSASGKKIDDTSTSEDESEDSSEDDSDHNVSNVQAKKIVLKHKGDKNTSAIKDDATKNSLENKVKNDTSKNKAEPSINRICKKFLKADNTLELMLELNLPNFIENLLKKEQYKEFLENGTLPANMQKLQANSSSSNLSNSCAHTYGFLGLNLFASRILKYLIDSGSKVIIYNPPAEFVNSLINETAELFKSPYDLVVKADIIVNCMDDEDISEKSLFKRSALLRSLRNGKHYIELSHVEYSTLKETSEAILKKKGAYLEVHSINIHSHSTISAIVCSGSKQLYNTLMAQLGGGLHKMFCTPVYLGNDIGDALKASLICEVIRGNFIAMANEVSRLLKIVGINKMRHVNTLCKATLNGAYHLNELHHAATENRFYDLEVKNVRNSADTIIIRNPERMKRKSEILSAFPAASSATGSSNNAS